MKDSIKQKALLFLFLLLSTSILAQDNKRVSDTIRWEVDDATVSVQDVIIDSNQVLVIGPGVRFIMVGSHSIIVYGEVLALGEADKPIRFSSSDEEWGWDDTATVAGGWGGFRFMNGAGKRSEFHHCIFKRGKNNIPGTQFATGSDALVDNEPRNFGGVIYAENYGTLMFENCRFQENMSRTAGGAIFVRNIDTVLIRNCYFYDNKTLHQGGAVWCGEYDYLHIAQSHFIRNTAINGDIGWLSKSTDYILDQGTAAAIGIRCFRQGANTIIENSRFHNNRSFWCVVELTAYNVIFSNNLMTNNYSTSINSLIMGGNVGWRHVYNNTFAYNKTPMMYATFFASNRFTLQNNIIWQNRCTCVEFPRHNVIECISSYEDWQVANNVVWEGRYENGTDIITDDPLFVNPAPLSGIDFNGWEYDWRLRNDSPAINAGSSQTYYGYELPEFDFEGNPRVAGSVDIGCYENQTVIGINENKMSDLVTIYPNPFHNSFKIKLNKGEDTAQISVYNATGVAVVRQQITSESNEITLENVPSGLYFLSVEVPNGNRITTKIVKE